MFLLVLIAFIAFGLGMMTATTSSDGAILLAMLLEILWAVGMVYLIVKIVYSLIYTVPL